jgi:Flp pilus assembly protein TadB
MIFMMDNNTENTSKKEYTAEKNYNKSISTPNLNLKSTLGINMQSVDSVNLNNLRRRNRVIKEEEVETKKEEVIPELSEIYVTNESKSTSDSLKDDKIKSSKENTLLKKIAPENLVAIVTGILLVVFMILALVLYNIFIG